MRKIKTAVIGCGKGAHLHTPGLKSLPNSEFVACCSSKMERAKTFATQYGVTPYDNVTEMCRKSGVEMVCVVTQHPQHAGPTIEAANCGAHVLVEKPLASSLADCDAMIAACRKNNVKLGTICQRRFYTPSQRIRKAIDSGKIGKPILGSAIMYGWRSPEYYKADHWRGSWKGEGGGVLVNQAPHQLDLLLWYMGEVAELQGLWENLNHPYIEVEDTALAIVRFKNGGVGNIIVSNSQNPAIHCRVAVHGSNGASVGVQTDGGAMFIAGMSTITEPPVNDLWTVPGEEKLLDQWKKEDSEFFKGIDATSYYHTIQIDDFLKAIVENREPLITAEDGRRTVELFTAIYRSNRTRAAIRFPLEPADDSVK